MEALGGEAGSFTGTAQGSQIGLTLGLKALDGLGISPVATTGQDGWRTFSHPKNFGPLFSRVGSGTQDALGTLAEMVFGLSSFLGRAIPQKTYSLVKERYHFTSSLSSITLSANKCGPSPAGRFFSSTQCWRALAYATTFSWGISLISLHM